MAVFNCHKQGECNDFSKKQDREVIRTFGHMALCQRLTNYGICRNKMMSSLLKYYVIRVTGKSSNLRDRNLSLHDENHSLLKGIQVPSKEKKTKQKTWSTATGNNYESLSKPSPNGPEVINKSE